MHDWPTDKFHTRGATAESSPFSANFGHGEADRLARSPEPGQHHLPTPASLEFFVLCAHRDSSALITGLRWMKDSGSIPTVPFVTRRRCDHLLYSIVSYRQTFAMSRREPKLDKNGGFAEPTDSCWSRFIRDVTGPCGCRPSFRAVDGSREIDIPASFSPSGLGATGAKLLTLGVGVFTIYIGVGVDPRVFWLAYLTNWNVTISSIYLFLSFVNSIIPVAGPPVGQTVVNFRVKLTWIFYTLSANIGTLVTIAYWSLIFDGVMEWATIFPHGILTLAVLIDGFVINSIPIRLRHYLEFVVPFAVMYMLWSYLHELFNIGNPDYSDNDPETNDDLIYDVLDWENDPRMTAVVALALVFVLSPVLQVVLWMISGCRRRYKSDDEGATTYIEMGSTDL